MQQNINQELIRFIARSASPYHAVREVAEALDRNGFSRLAEADRWKLERGKKYYAIKTLKKTNSASDLLRLIKNYDSEAEFLVRCTGLSGQFRVLRYRMERDNLISRIESMGREEGERSRREKLLSTLCEEPSVSSATYFSSDALSLRSVFKGMGLELILIDLKEDKQK